MTAKALVELAEKAQVAGNRLEMEQLIARAEREFDPNDVEDCIYLWHAFVSGLSTEPIDVQEKKAFRYLVRAAELGSVSSQSLVADHFNYGLNGVSRDVAKFEYWGTLAARAGDANAVLRLGEYFLTQRKGFDDWLLDAVNALSSTSSPIARFKKKIERRGR